MIELIQFPWSPFCIALRRILEYSGTKFKVINIPNTDRSLVWKLTRQRYYSVPIIRDRRSVIFEVSDNSQVIAKYLDSKLRLGLFPWEQEGVQTILWQHIEGVIEDPCFKLNDVYWQEMIPAAEHLKFVRHKERRFGRGCLELWAARKKEMLEDLERLLLPFEEMLLFKPFLLGTEPLFVDFDLFGMLENFLHSGHYHLPTAHTQIKRWRQRMLKIKFSHASEKKLHS